MCGFTGVRTDKKDEGLGSDGGTDDPAAFVNPEGCRGRVYSGGKGHSGRVIETSMNGKRFS